MEAQGLIKQKRIRRPPRENVRSWSDLFSLCLNTSQTSADLALQCAQQLLQDVSIDSNRLIRLQSIAQRNQMNWTVEDGHGTECIARMEHALFAVDIRIDNCTDQIEQVCLVDQSSRTSCSQMLDCLKAKDYAEFEEHLRGFVALREKGSLLLEAERALSEACKSQAACGTSYWDLLPELGHFCPRVGGIPPKFYYFLPPRAFLERRDRTNEEMIEQEGYYFSLTTKDGVLYIELQPPVPCCSEALKTLPDVECGSEVKGSMERRLWNKDANLLILKVYKPAFKIVRSVAVPQICSIAKLVRHLRAQAFLHHILDLSELQPCSNTLLKSADKVKVSQVEISTKSDCTINIYFPPVGSTFPCTKVHYDGQGVTIEDVEKDKLEFVFKRLPSLIALLRLVQNRCAEIKEPSHDVAMDHSPASIENEVSLNAVFNSVIERFTARSQIPVEEPIPAWLECSAATPAVEMPVSIPEEKTEEPTVLTTPKIKIKPIMSPPEAQQPEEIKKKRKGRKPKSERPKSETADQPSETKRVEPLRIKISSLNASKRGKSVVENNAKKHPGRKRLAERKGRLIEEKEKQLTEIKGEKTDLSIESLNMLNDDKKKSSLSHFKIPRKKAPQETGPLPSSCQRSAASQQSIMYRPQSILSEPLPSTPQCYPNMDRSSSLSPQIGPNHRTLFPPAFHAPPASPRLRQPPRQSFSPALGYPMDIRQPRYRLTRAGPTQEFRFR